jgi:hypothetical protein
MGNMLRTRPIGGWWLVVGGLLCVTVVTALVAAPAFGQTPQPFPRQGTQPAQTARPPAAPPAPAPATPRPAVPAAQASGTPTAATLGFPLYPSAQFLASYDAGRGQRYYLFGTTALFADIVQYYRTQLREGGDTVFKEPPTHMFEVGRFREETMAFPPGVTVKDWTWGGSQGYPNPTLGGQPARFPTIVMIVPPPQVVPAAR